MRKVLFTKEISPLVLAQLDPNIKAEFHTFLKINLFETEQFKTQIDSTINQYLISSQNSVEAIKSLDLNGEFYVVGHKTSELLKQYNFNVKVATHYASELAEFILQNEKPKRWNFFCGNNRRDELVEKLTAKEHLINEIVVYESVQNSMKLEFSDWDAIVFMSPLGVQSYFQSNEISPKTTVFSIGTTTAEEVQKYCINKIIIPEIPTNESMVKSLNNYFYVEK